MKNLFPKTSFLRIYNKTQKHTYKKKKMYSKLIIYTISTGLAINMGFNYQLMQKNNKLRDDVRRYKSFYDVYRIDKYE